MMGGSTPYIVAMLVAAISALFATLMKVMSDRQKRSDENEDRHLTIIADNNKSVEKSAAAQEVTNEVLSDLPDLIYETVCDAISDMLPNGRTGAPQVRRRRQSRPRRPGSAHVRTRARSS